MKRMRITAGFWVLTAAVWLAEPELLLPTVLAAAFHELGHVVALWAVGGRVEGFTLSALGAELRLSGGLSYGRELPVALAGPVCSMALAWTAAAMGWFLTAGISLALGLFNLLPVRPLDGGRAVACVGGMLLDPVGAERLERVCAAVALGAELVLGVVCLHRQYGPALLCMGIWLSWRVFRTQEKA